MALDTHHELEPELEVLAQSVIGAAIEVHRQLGPGFLESVYEKALSVELTARGIAHACQHPTQVTYRGAVVGEGRIDMLVDRRLVVELKATGLKLALLLNFRKTRLVDGLKRIIHTNHSCVAPSRSSFPSLLRGYPESSCE